MYIILYNNDTLLYYSTVYCNTPLYCYDIHVLAPLRNPVESIAIVRASPVFAPFFSLLFPPSLLSFPPCLLFDWFISFSSSSTFDFFHPERAVLPLASLPPPPFLDFSHCSPTTVSITTAINHLLLCPPLTLRHPARFWMTTLLKSLPCDRVETLPPVRLVRSVLYWDIQTPRGHNLPRWQPGLLDI